MFVYVFIYSLNFVDRCHKPRFQTLLPVTFTFAFSPKFTNGKVPSTRDFTCVKRLKKHTIIDFLIKTIKSIDKLNIHMKENTFELYLSWATVQIYLFTEHAPARSVAMVTKWMLVELTHMFTLKYVNHRSQNLSQTWHFIFCTVVVINILWTIYETVTILSTFDLGVRSLYQLCAKHAFAVHDCYQNSEVILLMAVLDANWSVCNYKWCCATQLQLGDNWQERFRWMETATENILRFKYTQLLWECGHIV